MVKRCLMQLRHIFKFKTKADTNVIADVATKIMGTDTNILKIIKKN